MNQPDPAGGRARRRGAIRGRAPAKTAIQQMPWMLPQFSDPPVAPLDSEGVARIDANAMRILKEIGIDFLHEDAKRVLHGAGAEVDPDSDRVRMDEQFVRAHLATAPSSFTVTPRNPEHALVWGAGHYCFGAVASPPNVRDLDHGRREGTREDCRDLLRLTQFFNCIHFNSGYPVEPVDVHPSVRHLDALYDALTLCDKVMHAYSLGTARIEDGMEMVRIAAGLTHREFDAAPRMFTNINSSSPLKHDWPMLDGAMRCAKRGQPVIVTPFTLCGAMAPVTLAGAVSLQTAEALAAIVLLQIVNPGAPVVYGSFTSNVDMKSGAPAFGTPEYARATQMSGQMARFYGLPMRASNACVANYPDGQAVWESSASLQACNSAHCNIVYHAAGWLESGLCTSFEKFVMDCELLQQMNAYQSAVGVSEDDLAFDAIRAVGPHDHFLGAAHTQARYKTAFYSPFLSDWRNFESWELAGAEHAERRANTLYKQILREFEPPPMDEAIREELAAFVAKRREEGGAPTDF
ncbi:MAG: methyltransferase [Gammaproteobacteria bacterium]|nr:methyltransferase [Gammaproteobacteria bacterium]